MAKGSLRVPRRYGQERVREPHQRTAQNCRRARRLRGGSRARVALRVRRLCDSTRVSPRVATLAPSSRSSPTRCSISSPNRCSCPSSPPRRPRSRVTTSTCTVRSASRTRRRVSMLRRRASPARRARRRRGDAAPILAVDFLVSTAPRRDLTVRELPHFAIARVACRWFAAVMATARGESDLTRVRPRGAYGVPSDLTDGFAKNTRAGLDAAHSLSLILACAFLYLANFAFQPVRGRGGRMNESRGGAYAAATFVAFFGYVATSNRNPPRGRRRVDAGNHERDAPRVVRPSLFLPRMDAHRRARRVVRVPRHVPLRDAPRRRSSRSRDGRARRRRDGRPRRRVRTLGRLASPGGGRTIGSPTRCIDSRDASRTRTWVRGAHAGGDRRRRRRRVRVADDVTGALRGMRGGRGDARARVRGDRGDGGVASGGHGGAARVSRAASSSVSPGCIVRIRSRGGARAAGAMAKSARGASLLCQSDADLFDARACINASGSGTSRWRFSSGGTIAAPRTRRAFGTNSDWGSRTRRGGHRRIGSTRSWTGTCAIGHIARGRRRRRRRTG